MDVSPPSFAQGWPLERSCGNVLQLHGVAHAKWCMFLNRTWYLTLPHG
ncbi:hypothetical protein CABS01_01626 [Colletotrichum abscissum]|nr:uncharacterized protein CABS01_01626 [Colletotrichum abscissum]KAK1495819.1 hypothetical protein CABS01_01626 [Colletotrichum abscissum]